MTTTALVALRMSTIGNPNNVASSAACYLAALRLFYLRQRRKSTRIDAIDCFTNDLVVRKTNQWKTLKTKLSDQQTVQQHLRNISVISVDAIDTADANTSCAIDETLIVNPTLRATARKILDDLQRMPFNDVSLCLNVQTLSAEHIDQLLSSALADQHRDDFYRIVDECLRWRKLPTNAAFVETLLFLTHNADGSDYPERWIELMADVDGEFTTLNAGFEHFRARCRWQRGERRVALQMFADVYGRMRRERLAAVAETLRGFLRDTVRLSVESSAAGDAAELEVLDSVETTATDLSRVFGENQMLMWLWKCCFGSEWFRLQQRSVRMFGESEEIRAFVAQKTSLMCYTLLQEHNVDAVHRLIELLLQFDMKNNCRTALGILFDYQHWRGDLRACSEIMRSSLDIDAPLSEAQNQKLLNLLLGPSSANAAKTAPKSPRKVHTKFELQF